MDPLQLIRPPARVPQMTTSLLSKLTRPNPLWFSLHSQTQFRPLCGATTAAKAAAKVSDAQLKDNWLASLSCPFPPTTDNFDGNTEPNPDQTWVIGVDPDLSGALALLKGDDSAQVYDSPHLKVLVGKKVRRRLDAKSIVQLLQSFNAPFGTVAYIEQSAPFPQDGKQGWWSGGFGYGLWIGILVALGFSVVPVSSLSWKNKFELAGSVSRKDDSRRVAAVLFPPLSSMLERKKDHGRAEALLIAAYGKGMNIKSDLLPNPKLLSGECSAECKRSLINHSKE